MRAIVILLFSSTIWGASNVYRIELKLHHTSEVSEVFQKNGKWICKSEIAAAYPMKTMPINIQVIEDLKKTARSDKNKICSEKLAFYTNKKLDFTSCMNHQSTQNFLEEINQNCGR